MRDLYRFCRTAVCLAPWVFSPSILFSQTQRTLTAVPNTTIDTYVHGYYISLPANYSTSGKSYPLLIFLHGEGQVGDGSPTQLGKVLWGGVPMQIEEQVNHNVDAHFPDPIVVNGQSYEFIVMIPQMTTQPDQNGPEQTMVDHVISYTISHYRVDASKVSLTGLSMGGGIAIEYPGQSASLYGKRLASVVGVAIGSYDAPDRCKEIAAAHLPVWLTVNSGDLTGAYPNTIGYIHQLDSIHTSPTQETIFQASGHDAWTATYGAPTNQYGAHPSVTNSAGLNVFQWMVQYKRVGDSVIIDGGSTTPLPVTWGPYEAVLNNSTVTITWSTLLEQNNRYFIVQRSGDGQSFSNLDTIPAAGIPHSYTYVDEAPSTGVNCYRLSQVDLDGRTSYSGVMTVNVSGAAAADISLKPNPSSGLIYLEMTNSDHGLLEVGIADGSGKLLRKWSFDKQTPYWTQTIDPGQLPAGTYYITIKGTKTRTVRTFLRGQE